MNISPETFDTTATMINNPQQMILTATSAVALGTAAAKAFTIVHQGEMGVRMRSGSPLLKKEFAGLSEEQLTDLPEEQTDEGIYQIRGKGIVWLRPFIDTVVKINVTDRTTQLAPVEGIKLESKDDRQFKIHPSITWFVRSDGDNPYKALFNVNNEKDNKDKDKVRELEQTIGWICYEGLGIVLRDRDSSDLINFDPAEVSDNTKERCKDDLLEYGVELKRVRLLPVARSEEEVLKQGIENNRSLAGEVIAAANATSEDGKVVSFPPRDTA